MKNRSGEKIKLASIDELLGVVNEEYQKHYLQTATLKIYQAMLKFYMD